MAIRIKTTGKFEDALNRLVDENPGFEELIDYTVEVFSNNYEDTRLGVHALGKRMKGRWSMGIIGDTRGDLRIIFEFIGENTARLLTVGGHGKVYRSKRKKK